MIGEVKRRDGALQSAGDAHPPRKNTFSLRQSKGHNFSYKTRIKADAFKDISHEKNDFSKTYLATVEKIKHFCAIFSPPSSGSLRPWYA
jgi:hypothetical protein